MSSHLSEHRFLASESSGEVSAILMHPGNARWLLIFGHGAGAGMHHVFMQEVAEHLAEQGMATFRYHFPYMEQGKKAPNPPVILMATVRSAVAKATELADGLPLLAGGKSLGGRMTSNAAAKQPLPGVKGIVFFGFPLHAPGKPSSERADHLSGVPVPMLFLQGTRDKLADLEFLRPVCRKLGDRATLQIFEDADHSFHIPKRSGKTDEQIRQELARRVADWADTLK